jgi:hypothetical protein
MACGFEPVDRNEVDAEFLSRERVTDGRALVQDLDVGSLEKLDDGAGAVTCGFDYVGTYQSV